jgi:hypothetical protein
MYRPPIKPCEINLSPPSKDSIAATNDSTIPGVYVLVSVPPHPHRLKRFNPTSTEMMQPNHMHRSTANMGSTTPPLLPSPHTLLACILQYLIAAGSPGGVFALEVGLSLSPQLFL